MMPPGALALVLHAHLPFVRHPEHEHFLEELWFYEAMLECYLPLYERLARLADDGVPVRLALNLSPTLLAMMRDPLLLARFRRRVDSLLELCGKERRRRGAASAERRLAAMYGARIRRLRRVFERDCGGDLPAAFARLHQYGAVELIACGATHGFLPFLATMPGAARAQIAVGVAEFRRHFGFAPRGLWLPECAWTPALDPILAEQGIRFFVVESHGILHAQPKPRLSHGTLEPLKTPLGAAAFGRDAASARQVWSAAGGYPGDPFYREFYRDIGHTRPISYLRKHLPAGVRCDTGLKYHRITGPTEDKAWYDPARARERLQSHAGHFVAARVEHLRATTHPAPVITAPYDAELFGHWWFEGPDWLEAVFRHAEGTLRVATPSEYLAEHPPRHVAELGFSSWGDRGYGAVWLNPQTDWIYPKLHHMAAAMADLARIEKPGPLAERALRQAARELLLAQSSDWPFLITRGGAPHYAAACLETHIANFAELVPQIHRRHIDRGKLERLEAQFNLFPNLDYRVFHGAPEAHGIF